MVEMVTDLIFLVLSVCGRYGKQMQDIQGKLFMLVRTRLEPK